MQSIEHRTYGGYFLKVRVRDQPDFQLDPEGGKNPLQCLVARCQRHLHGTDPESCPHRGQLGEVVVASQDGRRLNLSDGKAERGREAPSSILCDERALPQQVLDAVRRFLLRKPISTSVQTYSDCPHPSRKETSGRGPCHSDCDVHVASQDVCLLVGDGEFEAKKRMARP